MRERVRGHDGGVHAKGAGVEQCGVELIDAGAPDEAHVHLHLVLEQLHGAIDARQAVGAHGVEERSADADALGAQTERLDDIGRAANATVDKDLDAVLPLALAQHGHHLGEDLDAGAGKVELAAAVVGEHDAVHPDLDGADDVLDALDALEHDRHLGDAQEPGDVAPAERGVDEGGDGARRALGAVDVLAAAALHVGPHVVEFAAHVLLAAAQLRRVHRDEQPLTAALLRVPHDALGDGPVAVDVQLQPLHLVALACVHDLVERAARQRRDHLYDVVLLRAPRQEYLALGVAQLPPRSGGDVEWDVDFGAQHGGRQVDLGHVAEDARAEPDLMEGRVVLPHGLWRVSTAASTAWRGTHDLVVCAARVVRPGGLLQDAARNGFKVHQVVALLQWGLRLDALLALLLVWVDRLVVLLNSGHIDIAQVLGLVEVLIESVRGMDGLVSLGGIFAGELEDDIWASCNENQPSRLPICPHSPGCSGRNSVTS